MKKNLFSAVLITSAALIVSPARTQQGDTCDQFAWPIAQERKLFKAPLSELASGATMKLATAPAAAVRLKKFSDVQFSRAPERMPKNPEAFAAVVEIDSIKEPGLYQLTASDEAWIDLIQNDAFVKSVGHSGKRGCPEVRKSIRFQLGKGPVIVQFSGVEADAIKFALLPVRQ
jgi:hypothetical protein